MSNLLEEHTVNVNPELDEDEFFSTQEGHDGRQPGTTWRSPSR